ncbi:MAG: hypothetical protein ABJQ29_15090 [Luteolibacter sp.]
MKTIILTALIFVAHACGAEEIDFLTIIKNSPETSKALGIEKLNMDEQATLNALLNRAYQLGAEHQTQEGNQVPGKPVQPGAARAPAAPVYITKIDEDKGDVLKLANGGIVEITRGYLGYTGYRKDAVLYKDGRIWKIWIEGKKVFSCDILKAPENRPSASGESVSISEVKGNGKILSTLGGSFYEVGDLHTIETALWLGPFEALLIDGTRLLNLEAGGEIIDVTKVR